MGLVSYNSCLRIIDYYLCTHWNFDKNMSFKPFVIRNVLNEEMIEYYDSSFIDLFSCVENPILNHMFRGNISYVSCPRYRRKDDIEKVRLRIEKKLKKSLYYTYVFHAEYYYESFMGPHRDNPACEVSITMHIHGDQSWPIKMIYDEKVLSFKINPGDGIVYPGPDVLHWREPYLGEHYNQLMFHYSSFPMNVSNEERINIIEYEQKIDKYYSKYV